MYDYDDSACSIFVQYMCHEHAKFRLANLTKLNQSAMRQKLKRVET